MWGTDFGFQTEKTFYLLLKGRHQLPHEYQRVLNKTIYCIYSFIFFSTVSLHFSKLSGVESSSVQRASRSAVTFLLFYSEIM